MRTVTKRALSFLAAGLLSGCGWTTSRVMYSTEIETRETRHAMPSELPREEDDGEEGVFLLGARELYWFAPGVYRTETRTVVSPNDAGENELRRTFIRKVVDFGDGAVWRSRGDDPWEKTRLRVGEYELAAERRRARIDFTDLFLRSRAIREREDIELFAGEGSVSVEEVPGRSGRRRALVTTEPGVFWELVLVQDVGWPYPHWLPAQLLHGVLGLSREESAGLADRLGGLPVTFRGTVLASGDEIVVIESELLTLREVPYDEELFSIPLPDWRRARQTEDRLESLPAVLRELTDPTGLPEGTSPLEALLLAEARLTPGDVPELEAFWRVADDFALKVESMRLALRVAPSRALDAVRRSLRGLHGTDALAAAEALIAERRPEAREAVLHVLENRRNYPDLAQGSVEPWAVRHLRVLSGLDLGELAEALTGIWPVADPASGDGEGEGADGEGEALAAEVEFWLRRAENAPDGESGEGR